MTSQLAALLVASGIAASPPPSSRAELERVVEHWSGVYGVDRALVFAVIEVESAWDSIAVSSAGAAGLMQLMPETAAAFGVRNRFDVSENIRGGIAYLAHLKGIFQGDKRLMLAAYITGETRVLKLGLDNAYSHEVHEYVARVAAIYRRIRKKGSQ